MLNKDKYVKDRNIEEEAVNYWLKGCPNCPAYSFCIDNKSTRKCEESFAEWCNLEADEHK